jgi:hypothetical protein
MLYPGDRFRMSDEMLGTYIRQLLNAQPLGEVNIAWQGGEPTLMGLDFFRLSIEYVEKYRKPGQTILHTMQTNGTLLNDEWCAFFKEHNFLVGLSVDGPKEMHDAYRVNKGGAGSFDQVMLGLPRRHHYDAGPNFDIFHCPRAAVRHGRCERPTSRRKPTDSLVCVSSWRFKSSSPDPIPFGRRAYTVLRDDLRSALAHGVADYRNNAEHFGRDGGGSCECNPRNLERIGHHRATRVD